MKINTIVYTLAIFIALCVLVLPQVASAQETAEIQQATVDAYRDALRNVSPITWGGAGFVFGCFAPAYALLSTPEIPVGVLLGKSPAYIDAYTRVYQENAKRQRIQAAVIGCAVGSAVSTATYYLFVVPLLDL